MTWSFPHSSIPSYVSPSQKNCTYYWIWKQQWVRKYDLACPLPCAISNYSFIQKGICHKASDPPISGLGGHIIKNAKLRTKP